MCYLVRSDVHTQIVTLSAKMTFSVQPTHAPRKTSGATKHFLFKTSYTDTNGNRTTAKCLPNYNMITLFDQNRKLQSK